MLLSPAMPRGGAVGSNVLRKMGVAKVTGRVPNVEGLACPGLRHGRTIRSTIPTGDVLVARLASDTTGFTVVDVRDIPGRHVVALIDDDQPCLAERFVRHVAASIRLLAHADRGCLAAGTREYERRQITGRRLGRLITP